MSTRANQLKSLFEAHHEVPDNVDEMTKQLHRQRASRAGIAVLLFVAVVFGFFVASNFLGAANMIP